MIKFILLISILLEFIILQTGVFDSFAWKLEELTKQEQLEFALTSTIVI
jgi:hypothetical protein